MMTKELARDIVNNASRCTEATLRGFGIDEIPHFGSGCLEYLKHHDYNLELITFLSGKTMRRVQQWKEQNDPTGSFFIQTKGHAMAIVDGFLIDTERKGYDGRKIQFAWRVRK